MTSLKNKTVIITGGGRGIGASACKLLADEGANVLLHVEQLKKVFP